MKIRILNWKINNIGGIATWIINIREGLRELGHDVELIHTSETTRMKTYNYDCTKIETVILAGKFISLLNMNFLCDELNSADLVIIAHPSPHPTKDQLRQTNNGRLWQQIYKNITTKKIVVFHDNRWEKTNSWLAEVAEYIDNICCAQYLFTDSVSRLPKNKNRKMTWLYFPAKISDKPYLQSREKICVSGAQWLYWKRHKELLYRIPDLPVKIHLYNSGLWYFNLRYYKIFRNYITDNYINKKAIIKECGIYYGNVPHQQFYKALQTCLCSIDFSRRGYVNYTHWEPLIFGAATLVHEDVLNNEWCKLPKINLVRSFNDETINEVIVKLIEDENNGKLIQARQEAWEFCKNHLDRRIVTQQLLDFVKE